MRNHHFGCLEYANVNNLFDFFFPYYIILCMRQCLCIVFSRIFMNELTLIVYASVLMPVE